MDPWHVVVLPAFIVALVIRFDALLIGPYFSIASVVSGMVGLDDAPFNSSKVLKYAIIRRFFYPLLLGIVLALFGVGLIGATAAGLLAAALLLWPAVFQPLPDFVSLRDWQLVAFWIVFFVAFGMLAMLGWYLVTVVYVTASGDVLDYLFGLIRDTVLVAIGSWFMLAFAKGTFDSLKGKVQQRQAVYLDEGSTDLGDSD